MRARGVKRCEKVGMLGRIDSNRFSQRDPCRAYGSAMACKEEAKPTLIITPALTIVCGDLWLIVLECAEGVRRVRAASGAVQPRCAVEY